MQREPKEIEEILSKLLLPDSEIIKEATKRLKEAVKSPGIVEVLCVVLCSSIELQVRQFAAIILRKKIKYKKHWQALNPNVKNELRENILQVLCNEKEKIVQKAIIQLISVMAKHDLPENSWPNLFTFIEHCVQSSPQEREMAMRLLEAMAMTAGAELEPHFNSLFSLFQATLNDHENPMVPFYTIRTLTELVSTISKEQVMKFQELVPRALEVIKHLIKADEDKAAEAMDLLEELIDLDVVVVVPHLQEVMAFCMQTAADTTIGHGPRVKALNFIATLAKEKRKSLLKLKLVVPLIHLVFPIMCQSTDDDEDDDYDEAESQSPSAVAGQVLDIMSINLPPKTFMPPFQQLVEPALKSNNRDERRAAFLALAVACEGCADHIRTKLLKSWLEYVYTGLQDPEPPVRSAALFALGQFSEHLQPDIAKFANEFFPILFEYLSHANADLEKDPRGVSKIYYALETFVESLGKEIQPWLPHLMEYLLTAISTHTNTRALELALSALGATAIAAEKAILPYFDRIMELFNVYLTPTEDVEKMKVQTSAIDTLGLLARSLGTEFEPLVDKFAALGVSLLENATDPDLRRSLYGFFAALSSIMKEGMAPYLSPAVEQMLDALTSVEGLRAHLNEEGSRLMNIFDEEEDSVEGDEAIGEDELDIKGYSVENAFMDEKEIACNALGEIAINTGVCFLPLLDNCYSEVGSMTGYPDESIRAAAVRAIGQFCVAAMKTNRKLPRQDLTEGIKTMLSDTMPKTVSAVLTDKSLEVAMAALEALKEMIDEAGDMALTAGVTIEQLLVVVRDVMHHKTACQDSLEGEEHEGGEAELDSMLIETAGDLLPVLAKAVGGAKFAHYFSYFLPDLIKKTKKNSTVSERSFAMGTLAETLQALESSSRLFVAQLLPLCTQMIKDEDDEVRNNSVFALGVLAANGGDAIYPHYPNILKNLFDLLHKEEDSRTRDNICAAVCRMISTKKDSVPLPQVLRVIFECLPLQMDLEEYQSVLTCLETLYQHNDPVLADCMSHIVKTCVLVLTTDKVSDGIKLQALEFLQKMHNSHQDEVKQVLDSQTSDIKNTLQQVTAKLKPK